MSINNLTKKGKVKLVVALSIFIFIFIFNLNFADGISYYNSSSANFKAYGQSNDAGTVTTQQLGDTSNPPTFGEAFGATAKNFTATGYSMLASSDNRYANLTSGSGNDEPFGYFNFTISESISLINSIDVTMEQHQIASTDSACQYYVANWTSGTFVSFGTSTTGTTDVTRTTTYSGASLNNLIDSNGVITILSGGAQSDAGEGCRVDYVGVVVKPLPIVYLNTTNQTFYDTTPTLNFTGYSDEDLSYNIQIDKYPNFNSSTLVDQNTAYSTIARLYSGSVIKFSQTFNGTFKELAYVKVYMGKGGSPTGTVTAKLYDTSGGLPIGTPLAVSNSLDVSTFSATAEKIFNFSGFYMEEKEYAISIEYDSISSSLTNSVTYSVDGSLSHIGQMAWYNSEWGVQETYDSRFSIYVFEPEVNAFSFNDAGFLSNPDNSNPFTSGQMVNYTTPTELSYTTYYWRVRANDSTVFGDWSEIRNFTIDRDYGNLLISLTNITTTNLNSMENKTIRANITCINGECGEITTLLRYNSSSINPDTPVLISYFGENPFYIFGEDYQINLEWTANTTGTFDNYGSVSVDEDGFIYVTNKNYILGVYDYIGHRKLFKLNQNGSEVWNFSTDYYSDGLSGSMDSTPIIGKKGGLFKDYVFIATYEENVSVANPNRRIFAVNKTTGSKIWHYDTSAIEGGTPSVTLDEDSGMLFFISFNSYNSTVGYLYALNASNGSQIYNSSIEMTAFFGLNAGKLLILEGIVYSANAPSSDKSPYNIYAWNKTNGNLIWRKQYGNKFWDTSPVYDEVNDLIIYSDYYNFSANTKKGNVLALNRTTGDAIWVYNQFPSTISAYGTNTPVLYNGVAYFLRANYLVALNTTTQAISEVERLLIYKPFSNFHNQFNYGSVSLSNNLLVFQTHETSQTARPMNTSIFITNLNGNEIASYRNIPAFCFSNPTLANGRIYLNCDDWNTYAFNVTQGEGYSLIDNYNLNNTRVYENAFYLPAKTNPNSTGLSLNDGESIIVEFNITANFTASASYLIDIQVNSSYGESNVPSNNSEDLLVLLNAQEGGETFPSEGTVKLSNTYNLADLSPYEGSSFYYASQVKWNISGIPEDKTITDATMCIYTSSLVGTPNSNIRIWGTTDQTWDESSSAGTITSQTMNNQKDTTLSSITDDTYACINVTDIVRSDYSNGNSNSTVRFASSDYIGTWDSISDNTGLLLGNIVSTGFGMEDREGTTGTTNYPYLNITYETPSAPVTTSVNVSLISPSLTNNNYNATRNQFFRVDLNVTCLSGDCGAINVTLDPQNNFNSGLVTYLKLNENASTTNVTNYAGLKNATASNNTQVLSSEGKVNKGFYFEGSGDPKKIYGNFVNLNYNLDVAPTNSSVCFWYKSNQSYFQMMFTNSLNGSSSNIEFRPSDNTISVESFTNNLWDKAFSAGIDIDDGKFHSYCFVFGQENAKLYTDGIISDTEVASTDNASFRFKYLGGYGATSFTYGEMPTGTFDEIMIWNRTISSEEIQEIYLFSLTYDFNNKGIVSNVAGDTPFYTNSTLNPKTTSSLSSGQSETVTFYVNATGTPLSIHDFFAYVNVTSNMSINDESSHWNVTIVPENSCYCSLLDNNWQINLADNCVITTNCNISTGNISFINTGTVTFNSTIISKKVGGLPANQKGYIGSQARITIG